MSDKKNNLHISRRQFISTAGMAGAALFMSGLLPGLVKKAYGKKISKGKSIANAENIKDVLKKHFGNRKIENSHVNLKLPIIAENGAVVPIKITSGLPMEKNNYVKKVFIFVDANIHPYVASFDLSPANGKPDVSMRIKMRKTSNVRVVLETNKGKLYGAMKSVKVTIGGCGG
ncbi:sulfur oxidation protein SoxY [bacterium BMS3Abin07]|nr:sulfur oxidation protein SoxY [bacterium BMS3Abin07]GBE31216.1 sulfur oxidation protein SoxY [bacterium BMS3Bbin05]HDO23263.1 thiosulfate oxidation carrier protein SoxY [Nitrospirota bacterium]HDZ87201.1 thiosulfate oxidation carrier protein SoxY [Nitrospirota bacterium]